MKPAAVACTALALTVALAVGITWPKEVVLSAYQTSLAGRTKEQVHNTTLAARKLNGTLIKPGELFSFNQRLGSFGQANGYRKAPVAYSGRLIADWGGGVCQTSSTLYNAVLQAGLPIAERHPHEFCPLYIAAGRDAAVAYPGVDLRFVNDTEQSLRVVAQVSRERLIVRLIGTGELNRQVLVRSSTVVNPKGETVTLGSGPRSRISTVGMDGYSVTVYRQIGSKVERVSQDEYPVMPRVIQRQ